MRGRLIFAAIALGLSAPAIAERSTEPPGNHNVVPDRGLMVPPLRAEYAAYRDAVLADPNISPDRKTALIKARFDSIEAKVRQERQRAYEAYYFRDVVENSATKGSGGGDPKISKEKCKSAPQPYLYTTKAWTANWGPVSNRSWDAIRAFRAGEWRALGDQVRAGGASFCTSTLKQSGKGNKRMRTFTNFRYRAAYIVESVNADTAAVMGAVIS